MAQGNYSTWIKPVLREDGVLELHFPGDISFLSREDMSIVAKFCAENKMDIIAYSGEDFEYIKPGDSEFKRISLLEERNS